MSTTYPHDDAGENDVSLDHHTKRAFDTLEEATQEEVDTSTPTHLTEGFRGPNTTFIFGAVAIVVLVVIAVFGISMANKNKAAAVKAAAPQPITTPASGRVAGMLGLPSGGYSGTSYNDPDTQTGNGGAQGGGSSNQDCGANSAFQFSRTCVHTGGTASAGTAGAGGNNAPSQSCPAGYVAGVNTNGQAICGPASQVPACPAGYTLVRTVPAQGANVPQGGTVTTQSGVCVPNNGSTTAPSGAGSSGGAGGNGGTPQQAAAPPTPLPAQSFDVGQVPQGSRANSQDSQARSDINARGGSSVSAQPQAPPQPQPVFANGQFVGFVYPANSPIVARTNAVAQRPVVSDQFAADTAQSAGSGSANVAANNSQQATTSETSNDGRFGYAPVLTEDQLDAMTVIPLALRSNVNSELPGTFLAQVSACVYDSRTHRYCVIPPGTMASGQYDARLVGGQKRLLGAVTELRFQNGEEFYLGNQEVTDALGASGMTGHVDNHGKELLNSALMLTVLGGANAALTPPTNGSILSAPSLGQQIQSVAAGQLANIGDKLVGTQLTRSPVITIQPPYHFDVLVMRDLPLHRYRVNPGVTRLVPATPKPYYDPASITQNVRPRVTPAPTPAPQNEKFCC